MCTGLILYFIYQRNTYLPKKYLMNIIDFNYVRIFDVCLEIDNLSVFYRTALLKIPTDMRQTSLLFTKRDRGSELATTEKQIPQVAGLGWRP